MENTKKQLVPAINNFIVDSFLKTQPIEIVTGKPR